MVKIALIVPGATDYDAQKRIQGSLNIPLNDLGQQEVSRMADELAPLHLEMICCSDCEPALETATLLAERLGVKLKKLDKMQNVCYGLWQGMLVDEVKHRQPKVYRQWQDQPESICPPDGETLSEARERVQACLARLVKKHKQSKETIIGLVVPEPLASLVRVQLAHGELGDLWKAAAGHARWGLIPVEPAAVVHTS